MINEARTYNREKTVSLDKSWWRVLTKCGPLVEVNGKPLHYSCLEKNMKRQKDMMLKDELPRLVVPSGLLEKSGEITSERMTQQSQVKTMPSCGCDW